MENLFDTLTNQNILNVPSKSWAIHFISGQEKENKKSKFLWPQVFYFWITIQALQMFLDHFDNLEVY